MDGGREETGMEGSNREGVERRGTGRNTGGTAKTKGHL